MIAQGRLNTFDVSIISGGKVSLSCTNSRLKALFCLFACGAVHIYTGWTMHNIAYTQLHVHTSWLQHTFAYITIGVAMAMVIKTMRLSGCVYMCAFVLWIGVYVRCTWCIPSLQAYIQPALCMCINMIMSLKEFSPANHFNCQSFDCWLFGNSHAFKSEKINRSIDKDNWWLKVWSYL